MINWNDHEATIEKKKIMKESVTGVAKKCLWSEIFEKVKWFSFLAIYHFAGLCR